jgi:hypothetical protein
VVLWGLARHIHGALLPNRTVVLRVDVSDDARRRFWLLADPHHVEVCLRPPGQAEDAVMATDSVWLTRWHAGRVTLAAAMRTRAITVQGPRSLVRMLASWGGRGAYPVTS